MSCKTSMESLKARSGVILWSGVTVNASVEKYDSLPNVTGSRKLTHAINIPRNDSFIFEHQTNLHTFGKLGLLVYECHYVHGLRGNHVERLLVVDKLDVLPVDRFEIVLFLFKLEDMLHEELL